MKAKTLIKRTPAREVLATAIAEHRQAVDALAALKASRERAAGAVRDAETALAGRRADHERAKEDHVERIANGTAVGINVSTSPALKVREAKAAVMDAEDDLTAAQGALAHFDKLLAGEPEKAAEPEPGEDDGSYTVSPWVDNRPRWQAPTYQPPPCDPLKRTADAVFAAVQAVVLEHGTSVAMKAFEDADAAYSEAVRKGALAAELAARGGLTPEMVAFLRQHGRRHNVVPMAMVFDSGNGPRVDTYWPDDFNRQPLPEVASVKSEWIASIAALATNADAELPAP